MRAAGQPGGYVRVAQPGGAAGGHHGELLQCHAGGAIERENQGQIDVLHGDIMRWG